VSSPTGPRARVGTCLVSILAALACAAPVAGANAARSASTPVISQPSQTTESAQKRITATGDASTSCIIACDDAQPLAKKLPPDLLVAPTCQGTHCASRSPSTPTTPPLLVAPTCTGTHCKGHSSQLDIFVRLFASADTAPADGFGQGTPESVRPTTDRTRLLQPGESAQKHTASAGDASISCVIACDDGQPQAMKLPADLLVAPTCGGSHCKGQSSVLDIFVRLFAAADAAPARESEVKVAWGATPGSWCSTDQRLLTGGLPGLL
jgi:hypothetical protein